MTSLLRSTRIIRSLFTNLPLSGFYTTMLRALFRKESILVFVLKPDDPVAPIKKRGGVKIRKGVADDIERAKRDWKPLPWEFCCQEYDGIEDFFVAAGTDGLRSIIWAYDHRFRNRFLNLRPRDVMLNYALTLPQYRGRGLYTMVLQGASKILFRAGFERIFILVHVDNHASIRGITRAGFKRVAKLRLLKLVGCQISARMNTGRL